MEVTGIAVELAVGGNTTFSISRPSIGSPSWPEGTHRVGPLEISLAGSPEASGVTFSGAIANPGRSPYVVRRVGLRLDAVPRTVLETGYQSWSPVRRCSPSDTRPGRRLQPLMARGSYHSDPGRAGRVVAGDQYLVWAGPSSGGVAGFLDSREHLSTIESHTDGVWAWALLDRIVLTPGSVRRFDPFWIAEGDPGSLYSEFASLWGATARARNNRPSPATTCRPGWCSWYQHWWKVNPDHIRRALATAEERDLGLLVLDDGYQSRIGDWLSPGARWSEPGSTPSDLASEVRLAGREPGIWTAPFLAGRRSKVATSHPEWTVRAARGAFPLPVLYNPVSWGGWVYALDTTQPAVLDHLRSTFSALSSEGFGFHKVDFCYAATMPGRRQGDGVLTRAQGLRAGLQAIREGIGEEGYLLGCGCPFGPAVGVVDAMRVSPDTAPWWRPTLLSWPAYHDTAPAAVNAVRASVLRAPLHRRLFANDPDCLLLRPTGSRLTPPQRQVIADTAAGTGGFTLLSDDLSLYGEPEWEGLSALGALAEGADTPLDIVDPFARAVTVRSATTELCVDWDAPSSSLTRRQ